MLKRYGVRNRILNAQRVHKYFHTRMIKYVK